MYMLIVESLCDSKKKGLKNREKIKDAELTKNKKRRYISNWLIQFWLYNEATNTSCFSCLAKTTLSRWITLLQLISILMASQFPKIKDDIVLLDHIATADFDLDLYGLPVP